MSASGANALGAAPAPAVIVELRRASGTDPRHTSALYDATLALGAGVHAVLGGAREGAGALAALLGGECAPSHGAVLVAGRAPARHAAVRRRIASLRREPELRPGRVGAAVSQALVTWGADAACIAATLEKLGSLAGRRSERLTRSEARAVELALALAHPAPALLVLDEPFCELEPADHAHTRTALRARASAGSCVLVLGAAASDAVGFADSVHLLERGRLGASVQSAELASLVAPEFELWLRHGGRALLAALCADASLMAGPGTPASLMAGSLAGLAWRRLADGSEIVTLRAPDECTASRAVARALAACDAELLALHSRAATRDALVEALRRARAVAGESAAAEARAAGARGAPT